MPASQIEALSQRLDQLGKSEVWQRRKLLRQIDDLRIEMAAAGVLYYKKLAYQSSDGLMIPAHLFKPIKPAAGPVPAVIYSHGGQHGRFRPRSFRHVEAIVRRGRIGC